MSDNQIIAKLLEQRDNADLMGDMSLSAILEIAADRLMILSKIADMNEAKF